ncbi:MAG: prepilin-type N-terminal cleavage/methylation domain-containing protein [Burkholderiaceae bacterium]|jgi:general secretion pathway protein J|nr:prepilin-type N-terminal cleavage/methylation domain-containing protein [Burkholderiaceae bacterium]
MPRRRRAIPNRRARAFTLVEVLVALGIMAVMALMTWRGIDGITRAQEAARQHTDGVLALQAALAQWRADLDAMLHWPQQTAAGQAASLPNSPAARRSLDWNGRVLRLTRATIGGGAASGPLPDGVRVVAWTRRSASGQWLRWQSPPLTTQAAWRAAWEEALRWGQSDTQTSVATAAAPQAPARAVLMGQVLDWQLHYFRNNAWSNPLSSAAGSRAESASGNPQERAAVNAAVPDGIRLMLTLPPGSPGGSGTLSVDWARPTLGGGA